MGDLGIRILVGIPVMLVVLAGTSFAIARYRAAGWVLAAVTAVAGACAWLLLEDTAPRAVEAAAYGVMSGPLMAVAHLGGLRVHRALHRGPEPR